MYAVEAFRSKFGNAPNVSSRDADFSRKMLDVVVHEGESSYCAGGERYHLEILGAELSPHGKRQTLRVVVAFKNEEPKNLTSWARASVEDIIFTFTFSPRLSLKWNLRQFRRYLTRRTTNITGLELTLTAKPRFEGLPSLRSIVTSLPSVPAILTLIGILVSGLVLFVWLLPEAAQPGVSAAGENSNTFTITEMVKNMGGVSIGVVIVLLIMSVYSIAIMVERYLTYSAAKKQSREFAPRVAQALKNDRIEEAINISDKHRKSHLAMVVSSGLQEFRAHEHSSDISGDEIEASKRALQRAIAIKTADFRRRLSGLAAIGSTAPFVGLFGTVFGIINAFRGMQNAQSAGIAAVAGGITEALFTTALGLLVAVPAVWLFNYFTEKVDGFIVEMDESAVELVDYFIRNQTKQLKNMSLDAPSNKS